ncbi:hypothetical protein [Nitrosopumilus sp.]|nr:hypothetical protein [Nitrosopumilus sp.]
MMRISYWPYFELNLTIFIDDELSLVIGEGGMPFIQIPVSP